MGYDISDYQDIDPRYGNLDDWEQIKDACHERGMKLVMDLVVNHSSDQVSNCSPIDSCEKLERIRADCGSTHGSRKLEAQKTAQSEIGTSGTMARPTTRARRSHPTTGDPVSERRCTLVLFSAVFSLTRSVGQLGLLMKEPSNGIVTPS